MSADKHSSIFSRQMEDIVCKKVLVRNEIFVDNIIFARKRLFIAYRIYIEYIDVLVCSIAEYLRKASQNTNNE